MNVNKIIDNITEAFNAAVNDNDSNGRYGDGNGDDVYSEGNRRRYQELKRRYEFHKEFETRASDYGPRRLPNSRDSSGFAKYVGGHCDVNTGCILECPLYPTEGYLTIDGNIVYGDPNED